MREMLTHYEHTIDQKDQTEKNLNKALDLLYNKTIAYRRYYEWRIVHIERRRQQYGLILAQRFYDDKMKRVSATAVIELARQPSALEIVDHVEKFHRSRMEETF